MTQALKEGRASSSLVEFDFADVKVPHTAFKRVVCVKNSLPQEIVDEVLDLLCRSKSMAGNNPDSPCDTSPFGLEENRCDLEVAIDYVFRQGLIPRRYSVDELVGP